MKQLSQITLMMLLLLLSIKLSAGTYSGGTGTSGDPYQIATLADLIELSSTSADWASTVYFIQTADIDATSTTTLNAGAGFSPIGKYLTSFQGYYDGQYHTITNLFINRSSPLSYYIGLFGVVNGASIQNIGMVECNITGYFGVGGLVGTTLSSSIINNCFSTGSIIGLNQTVGGLIGMNDESSSISRSYSSCSVSGFKWVGGLVGHNYNSSISYSYSTGIVSCSSNNAGGLVGSNESSSTITNCYSLSNLTRTAGTFLYFGGFCGYNDSQIENCYSTGSVSGDVSWTDKGFVGYDNSGTYDDNFFDQTTSGQTTGYGATGETTANMKDQTLFENQDWDFGNDATDWVMSSIITFAGYPTLRWTGGYSVAPANSPKEIASLPNLVWVAEAMSISPTDATRWDEEYIQTTNINMWTTPSWDGNKGWTPIGYLAQGFWGKYNGQGHIISNLYIKRPTRQNCGFFGQADGDQDAIKNLGLVNVNITGEMYSGGLIGYNSTIISNCFVTGTITGTQSVGGLCGANNSTTINNCYSLANVAGTSNVGGLIGGYSKFNGNGSINNCYSVGKVTGSGGGLIGNNYLGTVNNCFWDTETSGKALSAGGTGKTTIEMKNRITFTTSPSNWDFTANTGVWKIESSTYISYPYLQTFTYDAPGASALGNPIPGLQVSPGPFNPTSFAATVASSTQIDLSWVLNGNGNDVVLAFNSSSTFGTPTGTYTAGDPITGGGTVLYVGTNTGFNHTPLSVNTQYYYKIWSTDGSDYSDGATDDEWTLANVPSAPTVNNPDYTSIDVAVNGNSNPATTGFAIHETSTDKFVQLDGTLGVAADWATEAIWGTKTVSGLASNTQYTFEVKARNGSNVETSYSASANGSTLQCFAGQTWTARTAAEANPWQAVTSGAGKFVAVANDGTNRAMTSTDGINWTAQSLTSSSPWKAITYGNGLFLAVGSHEVALSADGVSWNASTSGFSIDLYSVTFGNGLFVAVGNQMINRIITSPAGVRWQGRGGISGLQAVTYGNGVFVAVGPNNNVQRSTNGTTWNTHPITSDGNWQSVTYGNGKFVAVSNSGTNRVMTSTDGITWTNQTAPEKSWTSVTYGNGLFVAVSSDGNTRLMTSTDGETWVDEYFIESNAWRGITYGNETFVAVSSDGTNRVVTSECTAPAITVTTQAASAITATLATGNGNIVAIGSGNATNRGIIYYPYTNTDKEIGGVDVTNVSENGDFGTGAFTASLTGLSANTRYNARAHATNAGDGTKYGDRVGFWTLANVPSAPTVNNPTATSLDVAVNANGNPLSTEFAIHETSTNKFVQTDGTLGVTAVWATAATWGTKTVTGLTTGNTYTFEVKARNGENTETAYGASTSGNTCSNPTDGGEIGSNQTICTGGTPDAFTSISGASNYGGTLEYKWQVSTTSGVAGFTDIASSNSATYSPGALTQATWYKRLARVDCKSDWTGAAESNVVKITIEPTPVSGTLTKTPDVANVCEGTDVSATLTAGSGGNGSDQTEYRTHNGTAWSSWATYTSGTDISTTDKTQVEIQTLRQADYCNDATANTVSWTVDPTTVAGSISGSSSITYGSSTGNLTLTGNTGEIQKWQKRPGTSGGWTDISHTSATYSETPASAGTWQYRVLVQSGTCDEAYTEPHSITVEPKELTIGGSFTANDKIYDDNTDATFDNNTLELTGVVGTDDVTLTGLEIDFASKTTGEHTVTITSASLAGADKDNYTLTLTGSPETTATIHAGPPVKFLVTDPDGNDISSPKLHNIPFDVKATLVDAFDNPTPNTGGNVTITLTGSGGATPGDLRFQGFPADPVTKTLNAGDTISNFANVLYTGVSAIPGFDVKVSASASGTGTANGKTGESNLFSVRDIFFSVAADPTAILADGTSKTDITVTLEDHDNNPLANQTITVETDKGTLMEGAVELSGIVSRNTDANGQVFLQLRSDNVSVLATVTAKCPGACPQTVKVAFTLNAPVITSFTPGEEQVDINFTPPSNTGLTTISNYEYSLNDGTDWTAFSPAQTGSPVTITGLTGGQTYLAKLRAVNEVGTGAASESEEVYSCYNPTDGGEIGSDQTINNCETPAALTSNTAASGHYGTLEYQWQKSTTSAKDGFSNIGGATSPTLQPETLNDTTWYRRLARVSCKPDWTEAVASNVVKITVKFVQTIQIPQGWSYISSYLEPTDPNMVNMWSDIVGANNLAILTGTNGIYAPAPFYINTLNNWDVNKGYKVKMNAADELQVKGVPLNDNTVTFTPGAHLIPVLTNQNTPLDEVFNDPANDILYMLDLYQNLVYWPGGGINSLTELVPGTGYLANFKNPVTLSYPPLGDCNKSKSQALPPAEGPWPVITTSNYHLISVSTEAINQLQNTDYIGAFDSQGNCVGYAELEKTGKNILLTIYGDEPMTLENDGLTEGELLRFRSFNIAENSEKELTATFNPAFANTDGLFYANGLSGISGFKESATGVEENDLAASVLVYPNPATDVVNVVCSDNLTMPQAWSGLEGTLITAEGRQVKTFTLTGNQTQLNVQDLQPGIYMLKLETEKTVVMKRVVIQ